MATKTFDLEIPIIQGIGSESISQATFGKTLTGSVAIKHDLQRIDILPDDPIEEWTISLKVNGEEITKRSNVKSGETIVQNNIKTKFWSNTKFSVDLQFSLPWDLTAKIKLIIAY